MAKQNKNQLLFDFDTPEVSWPDNKFFPLNLSGYQRTVLNEIESDTNASNHLLVVTGFTSLAHIIDFFGKENDSPKLDSTRIILGFEPEVRRRKHWGKADLDKEIKDYWLERGYSLFHGGRVISIIEKIKNKEINFKILDRLHAKIYVFDHSVILGSANFSKNGLTKQQEANIRIEYSEDAEDNTRYQDVKQIAENFYTLGKDYNLKMIYLLEQLIKVTSWQEALARAISSLIDGNWFKEYPELNAKLNSIRLWPSQKYALGQAVNIIQTQGCILIADPTGSGKTKLISTLQLVLFHWLWETGRKNDSNSVTICPPLVTRNWEREFLDISFAVTSPESMGLLSYAKGENYQRILKKIKNANIIIIDEAHNFLNLASNRSENIAKNSADFVVLATATPISKKAKDLLRLVELLGIDNLSDEELENFRKLKKLKAIRRSEDINSLRNYIKRFIVRRTKNQLKELIEREPEQYLNKHGEQCKFPETISKTYKTKETTKDKEIANQIFELSKKLKGVIYLRKFKIPAFIDIEPEKYIALRLIAARSLSIYNIQARLRSSKVALNELIEGTLAATSFFAFKASKKASGNILATLRKCKDSTIINQFDESLLPDWLQKDNLNQYQMICDEEIIIYKKIATLGKQLSDQREYGKAKRVAELFKKHSLVLAFDSTILTLDYLKKIFEEQYPKLETIVVTGNTKKDTALKKFELGSTSNNTLGLFSDSMSEGVNLQQASALVFLDMPSVLRIAEQRIGRIDRLDSPHDSVEIYWPDDSDEFALKTDKKLIKTSFATESLIGSNFDIPEEILDKHLDSVIRPGDMIEALKDEDNEALIWEGVHDAFLPVHQLYSGKVPLISFEDYTYLKEVESSVKVKISIIKHPERWLFIALKGDELMAPKWVFVDQSERVITDLPEICSILRQKLSGQLISTKWDGKTTNLLGDYLRILQRNLIDILPNKKKRALRVAKKLLEKELRKRPKKKREVLIRNVLRLFEPLEREEEISINYYQFAQQWLEFFNPYLNILKLTKGRAQNTVSLVDLLKKSSKFTINFDDEILQKIIDEAPYTKPIWNNIAACIIGVPEEEKI